MKYVILGIIALGIIFFFVNKGKKDKQSNNIVPTASASELKATEKENANEYLSDEIGYKLVIPKNESISIVSVMEEFDIPEHEFQNKKEETFPWGRQYSWSVAATGGSTFFYLCPTDRRDCFKVALVINGPPEIWPQFKIEPL